MTLMMMVLLMMTMTMTCFVRVILYYTHEMCLTSHTSGKIHMTMPHNERLGI